MDVTPIPHVTYPKRERVEETLADLASSLRNDEATRVVARRADQAILWELDVRTVQDFVSRWPFPHAATSGDDRPDIRRGRIRP